MEKRYALIGEHLGHSLSPLIHQKIMDLTGCPGTYEICELSQEQASQWLLNEKALLLDGFNITIPYKERWIAQMECSPQAKKIGAVNTVLKGQAGWKGYNTDYDGFKQTLLNHHLEIKDKKVYILGTGGASKAVYTCIMDQGPEAVYFVSRKEMGQNRLSYEAFNALDRADIIINATPVGMWPHIEEEPISLKNLQVEGLIDLIYNPLKTRLIKEAEAKGIIAINGLEMLIYQAIFAQELWQGKHWSDKEKETLFLACSQEVLSFLS